MIEEVVLGLLYDVVQIHKEEEIAVAVLIQVQDQTGHDERFPAPCRHVKKDLCWLRTAFSLEMRDEVPESIFLIRAQLKFGIKVVTEVIRHFPVSIRRDFPYPVDFAEEKTHVNESPRFGRNSD